MKFTCKHSLRLQIRLPCLPRDPSVALYSCAVSPHPLSSLTSGLRAAVRSEWDPRVAVTSSRLDPDFRLPLAFTHTHISVSVALLSLLFLSLYLIFKAARSCPLVFSTLVNTTCQGVTLRPPLLPISPLNIRYIPTSA